MTQKLNVALSAALLEIHRLKKGDDNRHGGYKYVSVDDVKDHVRPILAGQGLSIHVTEMAYEMIRVQSKNGETSTAKISYAIKLLHNSGEEGYPEIITVTLPYTGAQTAGAARSYAVKEWAKSSLLVSTGEKDFIEGGADADAYRQQDYTAPVQKSAYRAKQDGDDKEFKRIQQGLYAIEKEGSMDDLVLFWKADLQQRALKSMKDEWRQMLEEQKNELKSRFEAGQRVPLDAGKDVDFDADTGEIIGEGEV